MTNQTLFTALVASVFETQAKYPKDISEFAVLKALLSSIIRPVRSNCFGEWRKYENKNSRRTDGEYMGQQGRKLYDLHTTGNYEVDRSDAWISDMKKVWDAFEADCTAEGLLNLMMSSRKVRQSFRKQLINGAIRLTSNTREHVLFEKILTDLYRGSLRYEGATGVKLSRYWPKLEGTSTGDVLQRAKSAGESAKLRSKSNLIDRATTAVRML